MPIQGATYTFEDLSGSTTPSTNSNPNPYVALIDACDDDPTKIQARYDTHRTTRTSQQRVLLSSPDFPGVNLDAILIGVLREESKKKRRRKALGISADGGGEEDQGLLRGMPGGLMDEGNTGESDVEGEQTQEFVDHRHNLSFWTRPPQRIRDLVGECQRRLRSVIPDIWLMPLPFLHMTTLELTHSRTPSEIASLGHQASPLVPTVTSLPHNLAHTLPSPLNPSPTTPKRARLVKPALTYDAAALALTLVPAASTDADAYTYHHLRRDLWELLSETSNLNSTTDKKGTVPVASRYVVPSAHLTIARFVTRWDVVSTHPKGNGHVDDDGEVDTGKMKAFVEAVDGINAWLEREYWDVEVGKDGGKDGVEWVVGEEQGLEFHGGASWFGGGLALAKGRVI